MPGTIHAEKHVTAMRSSRPSGGCMEETGSPARVSASPIADYYEE